MKLNHICHPSKCDLVPVICMSSLSLLSDLIKRAKITGIITMPLVAALWATYWRLVFTWRPATDATTEICYKFHVKHCIIFVSPQSNESLWVFPYWNELFCPFYYAIFSLIQSQSSYDAEDYEGAQRLGKKALHMGIASIVIGLLIITISSIVHFTTVIICTKQLNVSRIL